MPFFLSTLMSFEFMPSPHPLFHSYARRACQLSQSSLGSLNIQLPERRAIVTVSSLSNCGSNPIVYNNICVIQLEKVIIFVQIPIEIEIRVTILSNLHLHRIPFPILQFKLFHQFSFFRKNTNHSVVGMYTQHEKSLSKINEDHFHTKTVAQFGKTKTHKHTNFKKKQLILENFKLRPIYGSIRNYKSYHYQL